MTAMGPQQPAEIRPIDPILLRPCDAAAVVGMSIRKFRDLLYAGEIESVRVGHSRLVVVESLRDYVNRLRTGSE